MPAPSAPGDRALLPVAALLVNAFVWGVSWIAFRHLDGLGLHSLWTTTAIYAVCTVAILLRHPAGLAPVLRSPGLLVLAAASGMTNAFFNWGVTIGEVIRVVLLFYLMPVWTALLARALLGERIGAGSMARIGLAVAGAAVVLWKPGMQLPVPESLADWLGVAGGAAFALTNVLLRRHAGAPAEARALAMFAGALVVPGLLAAGLSIAGGPGAALGGPPPVDARIMVAVAVTGLAFLVANLSLQYGAARLPAATTAVVMISEVLFAALSAALFGEERFDARTLAGGAMIVAASLLAARGVRGGH